MFNIIEQSVKHFFEEILQCKLVKTKEKLSGELYGSAIPLTSKDEGEFNFYLFFPKEAFETYQEVYLQDVVLNEDDWCDLSKEFANQIIGYAKIKLNEKGENYKLGIPEYLGRIDFANFKLDSEAAYESGSFSFRVGYKKI